MDIQDENTTLIPPSQSTSNITHRNRNDYQALQDSNSYEWNVEIDVKGLVNTGVEDADKFSFKKLLQYTGPGK
jgi:hypothetical protein